MRQGTSWKWPHYYWNLCKDFGRECYRTWRQELLASAIVIFVTLALTGGWKDFRTAMLATACTLGLFAIWHLVRVPWLLHQSVHGSEASHPGILAGIFGIAILAGIFIGGYELAVSMWTLRPLGTIEAPMRSPSVPALEQRRVVTVQGPCKLTAEQVNPARLPQSCPDSPPPTLRDRVLAVNTHLTEGDRNRFSNALSEFEESLNGGESFFLKGQQGRVRSSTRLPRWNNCEKCSSAPKHSGRLNGRGTEVPESVPSFANQMEYVS